MDGATDSIGAVVVERVYVPPDGHGMPFARHSLVAFPQNTSYGILALTEDNATIGVASTPTRAPTS